MKLNHTCLRVTDPEASIKWYTDNFGMKLLKHVKATSQGSELFLLGKGNTPEGANPFSVDGVLELLYAPGVLGKGAKVSNGNEEPHRGFGHLCFSVDNIEACQEQLLANGVSFKKKLSDGRQKDIAFVLDPDGYWVELIPQFVEPMPKTHNKADNKFNHTMVRVKDPVKSLKFYREVLGMKLLQTREFPEAKFTLYFLGYVKQDDFVENSATKTGQAKFDGLLELTHNYGTENDPEFKYHNGNEDPKGFGHIAVSLDDPEALCKQIKSLHPEVEWAVDYDQFFVKKVAFVKDPDNYWVELLSNKIEPWTQEL